MFLACTEPYEPAVEESAESTLQSYRRGLELVMEALDQLGGPEKLDRIEGLAIHGVGTRDLTTRLQGMHPERPDPVPVELELLLDLAGGAVAFDSHAEVNPDADEWLRYVYDEAGRLLIVDRLNHAAFWVPGNVDDGARYARVVPHVLLREALEARHTLRHLGSRDGVASVAFELPTGDSLTLRIEAERSHLVAFEYLLDLPVSGDTLVRWTFAERRRVAGLGSFPGGHAIEVGGRLLEEIRYESVVAGPVSVFPEGVEIPEPPPPPEEPAETAKDSAEAGDTPGVAPVRELAEGVYLALNVRGGFHVLFVDLGKSVAVVDAPAGYHELRMVPPMDWAGDVTSSSVGRRLLDTVRATLPGKDVSHVVLTHHHGDHAGGIRPFVDAGAVVVATVPTAEVVRRAAEARVTLQPDALAASGISPRIEIVRGEHVIEGEGRSLRLLDVGENPHAEGMLVVYLPEERILYQSDLFMPSGGAFPDVARLPVMRFFVEWLDASGLDPERIYAIHGSARVTEEQLETIRGLAE